MSLAARSSRLSIFSRTFALMIVALLVAEGIGLALFLLRSPTPGESLRLSDAARLLRMPSMHRDGGSPPPGGGPPPGERQPRSPPEDGGPLRGPPPNDGVSGGQGGQSQRQWTLRDSTLDPTAPTGTDTDASAALRPLLASLLATDTGRVRIFVANVEMPSPDSGGFGASNPGLGDEFLVAALRDDGRWRILESIPSKLPSVINRDALLMFGLGLIVLLPLAWIFAQALAAPLRRFAEAARRVGADVNAAPLPRDGPAEMIAAIDAFNAMQARLARLVMERSQMMGAIAHDLRTPLTRLAFRLDDLQPPLKNKVEADIQEMKLMISAALDFLKERSLGAQREHLDLRLLVESVVDEQADIGHDVQLESGGPIPIDGDPVALRRALVNLVDNALKYGDRARLRLHPGNGVCTIEIDDDGPGIPEPLQQRVFDPFFRAETSRNKDTGGFGLGLASVRAIALDHGGTIALRNRKNAGLRVTVVLPTRPDSPPR